MTRKGCGLGIAFEICRFGLGPEDRRSQKIEDLNFSLCDLRWSICDPNPQGRKRHPLGSQAERPSGSSKPDAVDRAIAGPFQAGLTEAVNEANQVAKSWGFLADPA